MYQGLKVHVSGGGCMYQGGLHVSGVGCMYQAWVACIRVRFHVFGMGCMYQG